MTEQQIAERWERRMVGLSYRIEYFQHPHHGESVRVVSEGRTEEEVWVYLLDDPHREAFPMAKRYLKRRDAR